MKTEEIPVNLKVVKCNLSVYTETKEKYYVKTKNGGYYRTRKPKNPNSLINTDFEAVSDVTLHTNDVYVDSLGNNFICVGNNIIKNMDYQLKKFEIPKVLVRIFSTFSENTQNELH